MELDYQEIINIIVIMLTVAFPIGMIFHIVEWIVGYMLWVMFPKRYGNNRF